MIVFFQIKKKTLKELPQSRQEKICHVGLEGGIYPL